jgi:hypothetical protein
MSFLYRLLATTAALDIAAFIVAFALRHAKHGLGLAVGNVAWFSVIAATLALLMLGATVLTHAARRRRNRSPVTR